MNAPRRIEPARRTYRFLSRPWCPLCGDAEYENLHRQPFAQAPIATFLEHHYGIDAAVLGDATYRLDQCRACSLIFQRYVGDDALLTELYAEWVHEHGLPQNDPVYQAEISYPLQSRDAHEIIAAAAFLGVPLSEMVTLDYGMGWALWPRIAKMLDCRSFGSDLAESRMAFARANGVVPIEDAELGEPRFHFINTEQVMEHVVDLAGTARRLASSLLPGGILKVSVPSGEHVGRLIDKLNVGVEDLPFDELMPVHPLEHVNTFTRRSLEVLAERNGLLIVRPSLAAQYAFLGRHGSISPHRPKKAAKELVRPLYQWRNRTNLYVWMQKR